MISVKVNIEIQGEDKRLVRIQAIGDNGVQYQVREECYVANRCVGTKDHGVISREKNETDKQFAMRLLQKATEK